MSAFLQKAFRTDPRTVAIPGVAAVTNFAAVLGGLWLISRYSTGQTQISLLNLWAIWGIGLGFFGQAGLLSAVLDGRPWLSRRTVAPTLIISAATATATFPAVGPLFGGHISWLLIGSASTGLLYLLGRQRGRLTSQRRGHLALIVAAGENLLRLGLVSLAAATDSFSFGALAICGPLLVSFAIFARLTTGSPEPKPSGAHEVRSTAMGLLSGVPAILAYGLVPALTLVARTERLDQIALASTVLRGPLILAGFLAPWLLERSGAYPQSQRRAVLLLAAGVLSAQAGVAVFIPLGELSALMTSAACTAIVACCAYFVIAFAPRPLELVTATAVGVGAFGLAGLSMVLLRDQPDHFVFLAVAVGCLFLASFAELFANQASSSRATSSPGDPLPHRQFLEEAA